MRLAAGLFGAAILFTEEMSIVQSFKTNAKCCRRVLNGKCVRLCSTSEHNIEAMFNVYYNDVYEVQLPPKHRFPMEKYRKVRMIAQSEIEKINDSNITRFIKSPLATFEELATTHSEEYIRRFLTGDQTEREQRNVGFPWSKQGVDRALSSVGGTLAATIDVCDALKLMKRNQNSFNEKSMFWGAHVAGGTHHAFYDYGEGFCVFSDIAVAANVALEKYPDVVKRIAIIDLDVHQGNGNARLFANNDNVFTFSLHCRENIFSRPEVSDLDIELPAECTDATYLQTLQYWLKRIFSSSSFDLVFFQAGIDIVEDDRLGKLNISRKGIEKRNEFVYRYAFDYSVPLIITMGGGYPKGNWEPILNAHADVYIGAHKFMMSKFD